MFPQKAVASIVGFGGMAGAVAGMLVAKLLALHLQWTGSYRTPFLLAGSAYLVALALLHAILPRLQSVQSE
jgi:ACS family hexuronate transporter-like MFS transporter